MELCQRYQPIGKRVRNDRVKRLIYTHSKTSWSEAKALCLWCDIRLEEWEVEFGLCFPCDKKMRKLEGWTDLSHEFKGWTEI
jgi:hypothetical protein